MLVLSRKVGEKIIIDDDIKVQIMGFQGSNQVKIGLEAPSKVKIFREELQESMQTLSNIKSIQEFVLEGADL